MENKNKFMDQTGDQDSRKDCNCEDSCCPPKKNNLYKKLIFIAVLLVAVGIVFVKMYHQPAPAAKKQVFRDPNSPAWCDSGASKSCDTTKGSSCCPK